MVCLVKRVYPALCQKHLPEALLKGFLRLRMIDCQQIELQEYQVVAFQQCGPVRRKTWHQNAFVKTKVSADACGPTSGPQCSIAIPFLLIGRWPTFFFQVKPSLRQPSKGKSHKLSAS